jgi:hypothetical protein
MTILPRLRFLLVTLALLFAAVIPARQAYAGSLHIRDEAHVLSADDAARLRSVVVAAPFDARLVVTSEYPDAQDLSRYVGSLVNEPNEVVVGLDPQHHHVQVHFGTGSRVPRSEWAATEKAGNEAFRRGDWEGGAAAIFRAASLAVASPTADATPADGVARPSLIGPGLLLLIVAGAIGLAVYFARRRSAYGPPGDPRYGAPPFSGPGYPPQGGGMGPLGGGLIGAGLGGLAGYELGKLEGEREGHQREPLADRGNEGADPGGNFDEGGGGSSWDNDGGGDFGGGGDGGGGGSDF